MCRLVYLVAMQRLSFLILGICFLVSGQTALNAQTAEEFEARYAERIRQEMINGVYIPYDLEDAHNELQRLSDKEGLINFKTAPEDSIRRKLHFGLGRWIMTNWGLEEGSRIAHYLKQKGVSQPDDMVRLIIVTWHRKLNQRPLLINEEIESIRIRMEAEKKKREENMKVISIERRPHKE